MKISLKYVLAALLVFLSAASPEIISQPDNQLIYNHQTKNPLHFSNYFESRTPEAVFQYTRMDSIISSSITQSKIKYLFNYDDFGKISEWLILFYDGSVWYNTAKYIRLYDENNLLVIELGLDWNTNAWDSSSRITYTYEGQNISRYTFEVFTTEGWKNSSRSTNDYDEYGNIKYSLLELWLNNEWLNNIQLTYFYSGSEFRDSILFQTWSNQWIDDKKTIFFYNANAIDVDSILVKIKKGTNWENLFKRIILNDNNHNQIEQVDQEWDLNEWINYIRRIYTYNENRYLTSGICDLWINNQWIREDGDLLMQNPDGFTSGFLSNSINVYYSNIVSADDADNLSPGGYYSAQNYPNPFNPQTVIRYNIPAAGDVQLKIFDLQGNEIAVLVDEMKPAGEHEVKWDASGLTSGIYFYRLRSNGNVITKKMMLIR